MRCSPTDPLTWQTAPVTLTVAHVAALTGRSPNVIRREARRGHLPHFRIGRSPLFDRVTLAIHLGVRL